MLRYGATLPISSLDGVCTSPNEATSLLYSRLITVDAFGDVVPDLAKEQQVSSDGLRYTFVPKPGATWSDGNAVCADDFAMSLRLVADPAFRESVAVHLPVIDKVDTVDSATVVTLSESMPSFLHALTKMRVVPSHRHTIEEYAAGASDDDPIGSGPYELTSRGESGYVFTARADSVGVTPAIESVHMRTIANDRDRAAALAAGEIDLAQIKPQDLDLLSEDVRAHAIRTRVWRAFTFRLNHPVLGDPAVRRALGALIDRDEIVERALGGFGLAQYWPVPPGSWASPEQIPAVGEEVAAATLNSAGWRRMSDGHWEKEGVRLSLQLAYLETETFRKVASEVIRDQLGRFGIPVQLLPMTWQAYRDMDAKGLRGSEYDGIVVGWSGGVDPYENLASRFHSDGGYNRDGYSNPELDRLLEQAVRAPDRETARALYGEVMRITHEDAVMVPLVNPTYLFGARADLTGFEDFEVDSFYEFPQYLNLIRRSA